MVQWRLMVRDGPRTGAEKDSARLFPHTCRKEWLQQLPQEDRHAIGRNLLRAQWRWPIGMPLCRPMGRGLWEIRTDLPSKRTARVLICLYQQRLVALHGFIKKTRATPDDDLMLARRRKKELEQ